VVAETKRHGAKEMRALSSFSVPRYHLVHVLCTCRPGGVLLSVCTYLPHVLFCIPLTGLSDPSDHREGQWLGSKLTIDRFAIRCLKRNDFPKRKITSDVWVLFNNTFDLGAFSERKGKYYC